MKGQANCEKLLVKNPEIKKLEIFNQLQGSRTSVIKVQIFKDWLYFTAAVGLFLAICI